MRAFGAGLARVVLGLRERFFFKPSSLGVESSWLTLFVDVDSSSSSSLLNESPTFFASFFRFLNATPLSLFGSLYLVTQHPPTAEMYDSAYRPSGVVAPLPWVPGVASLLIWSRASARLLRKSERCTRPTVCSFSTSSAVWFCEVNRLLLALLAGEEEREGSVDGAGVSAMLTIVRDGVAWDAPKECHVLQMLAFSV